MQLFTISYLFFIFDQPENSFFFCHHLEYATFYNFVFTFFIFDQPESSLYLFIIIQNMQLFTILSLFLLLFKMCNLLQFRTFIYYLFCFCHNTYYFNFMINYFTILQATNYLYTFPHLMPPVVTSPKTHNTPISHQLEQRRHSPTHYKTLQFQPPNNKTLFKHAKKTT